MAAMMPPQTPLRQAARRVEHVRAGVVGARAKCGGAMILEHVNAGLIDECTIAIAPVLSGSGIRL
ncbi:hypothetical protein [Dactylosporangium sp. NPDC005555]|uniref:hypothetical protein n=1 Tax=Dactylosporangium sp. NPDC005555 TaxID=3154889 RepID=UPI0033A26816